MRVQELAVVMDLAREVRVVLLGRLEHDLGAIGELVRGKIDLAEGAFADEPAERVVADGAKVVGRELAAERARQKEVSNPRFRFLVAREREGDGEGERVRG